MVLHLLMSCIVSYPCRLQIVFLHLLAGSPGQAQRPALSLLDFLELIQSVVAKSVLEVPLMLPIRSPIGHPPLLHQLTLGLN